MKAAIEALGITKEDIMNLAVSALVDKAVCEDQVSEIVTSTVNKRIDTFIAQKANNLVEDTLNREMEDILSKKFTPADKWGDPTGEESTIKDQLHSRALEFWNQNIDRDGNKCDRYGGRPRHEVLFEKIVGDQFHKAISQNYTNIVGALKDALAENAKVEIGKHLDTIIRVDTSKK